MTVPAPGIVYLTKTGHNRRDRPVCRERGYFLARLLAFFFGVKGVGGVDSIARRSFRVRCSASDLEYRSRVCISSAVVRFSAGSLFMDLTNG